MTQNEKQPRIRAIESLIEFMIEHQLCLWGHRLSGVPWTYRSLKRLPEHAPIQAFTKRERFTAFAQCISLVPQKLEALIGECEDQFSYDREYERFRDKARAAASGSLREQVETYLDLECYVEVSSSATQ